MTVLDRRALPYVTAARLDIGLTALAGVLTAGLIIVQAGLLADLVTRAFLGGEGLHDLAGLLVALGVVVAARALLGWLGEVSAHRASAAVTRSLRTRLLGHVLAVGPRHPGLPPGGELVTLVGRGVDGLDTYVRRYLPDLIVAVVVPVAVAIRILTADPVSALLIAVTVPLLPVFMILIGLHTRDAVGRQWRTLAALGHHFLDLVAGLDVLTAFGRARRQRGEIARVADRYRRLTLRTLRTAFLSSVVLEVLATLSVALVAVSVGLRLVEGRLDLATGILVIVLAPEVYLPLRRIGARHHDSAEGLAAADDVARVLAVAPAPSGGRPAPDPSTTTLRLDGVGVEGRAGPVLDDLSLDLAPGEILGIAGPSGAGKSTLVDVLLGWRPPDRGRVLVGDVDLTGIDRAAWWARVAWVPQRPVLVGGTIADNVRLAAPGATNAAVAVAAHTARLDLDLGTDVGELGRALSTGQQRRVALARALLADRPLLLLDEPTEGVDADTEAAILDALPAALAGRSAVVVSHRSAVLGRCDRVVALPGPVHDRPTPPSRPEPESRAEPPSEPSSGVTAGPAPAGADGPLRWLLATARPHRARLAGAVLAGSLALGCAVALTATAAWLISAAALHPPVLTLMVAIVAVRAFGLAKGGFRYLERLASHDVALRTLADLRVRVWDALVRLGPAATGRLRRGDLLARLVGDVDAQQDVLVRSLVPGACAVVVGAAASLALGLVLPAAGVVLLLGLVVAGVVAPAVTLGAVRAAAGRTAAARGAVSAAVVELLVAGPDLTAFGAAQRRRARITALDDRLAALTRRAAAGTGLGGALGTLAIGASTVGCGVVGIVALRAGDLPGPALAVLVLTPLALAEVVAGLPDAAERLAAGRQAARRLASLESAPPTVAEPAAPRPAPAGERLAAHALSVRWPGTDRDAVAHLDLDLRPGGHLAVSGPSGSGKSTLIAAVMRTLDIGGGALLVDGTDAREFLADDVRSRIAWCGPGAHLFDGTLRANLLVARPDATEAQLAHALRRAGLRSWSQGLPDGLDTRLGGTGPGVSGGEQQRLGIARALLADHPVLVLDEPTAHLDAASAEALCADLVELSRGRTMLVATHRPGELAGFREIRMAHMCAATSPISVHSVSPMS
ncbi:thiol reductant ABC exporter subunit CydD [Actinomycetospora endophytica]|uniref:Thiol reductant ABC exporter subunit CydD n=1 Tax=Actinomycetospora endophytica TaxID=2291215 RepID=A0ABS8PAB4_9PSEU|nr:thiol reductant ABC exporter subunit CydD [Actinomycetospora endophytica]MCD2195210.1 thiol reductant ABC exporter subunit CydD [Actinomycetospora endophytica]